MIARRRCVSELDPKNPQQGYVSVGPATGRGKKRPPGRDTGRPLARLPAPNLLRFRRKDFRGGPTRDVVRTIHVGPNQTAWPNGMAESNLCELRGKNRAPGREGAISRASCRRK